ncbi:ribonuclease-like [Carettochelys insculpta]|uniref:ribonuclease-like n=1 Tax=Carettochelys insculpta TaxID=44489 RepID=UPI003EB9D179
MAPRGLCPSLLLSLVLLPASLALLPLPNGCSEFRKNHVDFPRTTPPRGQSYCNYMMPKVRQNLCGCSSVHTFLHLSPFQLPALCGCRGKGLHPAKQCTSKTPVSLTQCYGKAQPDGSCRYRGRRQWSKVRVSCSFGLPVGIVRVLPGTGGGCKGPGVPDP